ncbi:Cytochrome P450 monooxygenase TRI4 [Metarhizium anisopliae]
MLGKLTRIQTPLSSTNYFVHTDGTIFPDPSKFSPDRWLGGPSPLRKHMVSFSRGTRRCVGQNLALAELKLAAARLVTRYDFKFVSTDMDILPARDCFIPQPYVGTGGVRAKILKL